MTSPPAFRARAQQNRYGRKQERTLIVDIHHRAFRFLNEEKKMRSEFPFIQARAARARCGHVARTHAWRGYRMRASC